MASTVAGESKQARPNFIKRSIDFLRDSWGELKRVRWPNRKELVSYTMVTIVTCLIVILLITVFDLGISYLLNLIHLGGK